MEIAIFIFYLLLVLYGIYQIPFFTNLALPRWVVPSLFVIKVVAGIAYALFYKIPKYYVGSDTWRFYRLSLQEKQWLLNDPTAFFNDLFTHGYQQSGNVFSGQDSYWNDLKSNIPVKLMALLNVITNDSYYTNIILFNFLFLFGLVALYKVVLPLAQGNKWVILGGIFLLPSTLFWCSGIHKDGLILSGIGLITYWVNSGLKNKFTIASFFGTVLLVSLIFFLRSYVALALLPAMLAWWFSYKYPLKTPWIFFTIYATGIFLFFFIPYVFPALNLPGFIVNKQQEFRSLEGGSEVVVRQLQPDFISFLKYLPTALDMAFLRPHPTEIKNLSYLPAITENILFLLLLLFCIWKFKHFKAEPTIFFLLFLGISILIIAGYTITLAGAIVRYRSLSLPFIFTPLLLFSTKNINLNNISPFKRRN